jgi:hypothetical protein
MGWRTPGSTSIGKNEPLVCVDVPPAKRVGVDLWGIDQVHLPGKLLSMGHRDQASEHAL